MGEGPKDLRNDTRDPRLRDEGLAGPTGDDVTGRPLTGLDRPGASEAVGYAGGYAPAVPSSDTPGAETTGDTAAIRADIEQTRANISETVDAIQQKLSPSNVMSQAADDMKEATRERMRQVADTTRQAAARVADTTRDAATRVADTTRQVSNRAVYVARENPWATAAAVAGVGALAWWLTSRRDDEALDDYAYDADEISDMTEESLYYEDFDIEEGRGLMQRMRGNALPLVVAGAGIGWWLWSRQSGRRASYGSGYDDEGFDRSWTEAEGFGADAGSYRSFDDRDWTREADETGRRVKHAVTSAADRAKDAVADAGERARGAMNDAGARARGMVNDAGQRARHVVGDVSARTRDYANRASAQVSDVGRRAGSELSYWMDRNPLAVGAAAMALGAAVGLALPESRREQQLIGPARDRLFDRAQSLADDAMSRAKQTVQDVANKATDAMNQTGTNTPANNPAPNDAGLGKNPR